MNNLSKRGAPTYDRRPLEEVGVTAAYRGKPVEDAGLRASYREKLQPLLDSGLADIMAKKVRLARRDKSVSYDFGEDDLFLLLKVDGRKDGVTVHYFPDGRSSMHRIVLDAFAEYAQGGYSKRDASEWVALELDLHGIKITSAVRQRIQSTFEAIDKLRANKSDQSEATSNTSWS